MVGMGERPPATSAPTRDSLLSNATSAFLTWLPITTSDLPIRGYLLQMDDGLGGAYQTIYDGSLNPQATSYLVTGLIPGRSYKFGVTALDVNGLGAMSPTSTYVSCSVPSGMLQPALESVTATTFTLSWDLPLDNGGCPITGYALLRDNGLGDPITTRIDPAIVEGLPNLFRYTTTLSSSYTGLPLRVKVQATNRIGWTLSPALQFALADRPG